MNSVPSVLFLFFIVTLMLKLLYRYKAVRKRWRSLVIPDPKRDLTFRQWRLRNNLPPSKYVQGNTNATKQVSVFKSSFHLESVAIFASLL